MGNRRHAILLNSTRRRLRDGDATQLRRDVSDLVELFSDTSFDVFLVGGVGMALRHSHFYRNHRDLDIAVFAEDLHALAHHLEPQGYRLAKQRVSAYLSPWHKVQAATHIDPSELDRDNPGRIKLRVLRAAASRWLYSGRRTDYIDVYLLESSDRGVVLHGYDATVPWSEFLPAVTVEDGSRVLLPNIAYKRHLPPNGTRQAEDHLRAGLMTEQVAGGRVVADAVSA